MNFKEIKDKLYKMLGIKYKLNPGQELIKPHIDSDGKHTSYFFDKAEDQRNNDFAAFGSSLKLKEIQKSDGSKSLLYIGTISGAGNAVGIIETEHPLEEIVKTEQGSKTLTQMLSKEYAMPKAYEQWDSENFQYDKSSTMGYFVNNPVFYLGKIQGTRDFELNENISQEAREEMLRIERENQIESKRRSKEDMLFGGPESAIYVGDTNCYRNQTPFKIEYCGVNQEALKYRYNNPTKISGKGAPYVYSGTLLIGKPTGMTIPDEGLKSFRKVIVSMDKPIDMVFVEDSIFSHQALGKMFSERNVESEEHYLGHIKTDESGHYEFQEPEKAPNEVMNIISKSKTAKKSANKSNIIQLKINKGGRE